MDQQVPMGRPGSDRTKRPHEDPGKRKCPAWEPGRIPAHGVSSFQKKPGTLPFREDAQNRKNPNLSSLCFSGVVSGELDPESDSLTLDTQTSRSTGEEAKVSAHQKVQSSRL